VVRYAKEVLADRFVGTGVVVSSYDLSIHNTIPRELAAATHEIHQQ